MFNKIKEFFTGKPAEPVKEVVAEAPYKVEVKSFEDTSDIAIAQRPAPVANTAPVEAPSTVWPFPTAVGVAPESVKAAPAKKPAVKKPAAPKKPAGGKRSGRKPKA
jgi:hypothetical protein